MLYNASVWVSHDEYEDDPDSWLTGPDDDFVPSEYNSVSYFHQQHHGITWNDIMDLHASWSMTPGDHEIDVTVAP